jgi:hypothetical protein
MLRGHGAKLPLNTVSSHASQVSARKTASTIGRYRELNRLAIVSAYAVW